MQLQIPGKLLNAWVSVCQHTSWYGVGLAYTMHHSHHFTMYMLAPASFHLFDCKILHIDIQYFPFSPASPHLGNLTSHSLFSRLPYTFHPILSQSPPPLSPSTIEFLDENWFSTGPAQNEFPPLLYHYTKNSCFEP